MHLWNLQTNQLRQVAAHQEPIRHVDYIKEMDVLVTASWDRTLKYWDLRQQNAVATVSLPERVFAFSVAHPLVAVGLANRQIQVRGAEGFPRLVWLCKYLSC